MQILDKNNNLQIRGPTMKPRIPSSETSNASTHLYNPFLVAMNNKAKYSWNVDSEGEPVSFMAFALKQQEKEIQRIREEWKHKSESENSEIFRKRLYM